MTLPFRFGCVAAPRGTAREVADRARLLDDLGYATLLVPDTLWTPSPFAVLAAAAAGSDRLHLGTWVLAAPLRSAAAVVREVKTLHELAPGRVELGLGAGRPGGESDAAALGVPWGSPGERVSRVAETAAAVRAALDPAPPIVIAGHGDRMLGIAARFAATLALPLPPTATVAEVVAAAERVRAVAPEIELALQLTAVGDAVPQWQARQGLTAQALRDASAAAVLSGDAGRDADILHAIRERSGVSYLTVPDELADLVGPLATTLTGR